VTAVSADSCIEGEIKERMAAGNRAFRVHKELFSSKLISRNVQLQLYDTLIRATVTYASETSLLKENMTNKVMICEREIAGKIFGATGTADGCWRIETVQEINYILIVQNIIGFIKNKY
jgi:hypothetical protein